MVALVRSGSAFGQGWRKCISLREHCIQHGCHRGQYHCTNQESTRTMNKPLYITSLFFSALSQAAVAQVAPEVIAREAAIIANKSNTNPRATAVTASALPLRNVQIEVRQVQQDNSERSGIQTNPRVDIDRNGQISMGGQLQIQQRQSSQTNNVRQYALVLNGNSTRISLGTSTPLRLVQTSLRNGVVVTTPGAVLISSNTGFVATPRWSGSDRVELDISAQQTHTPSSLSTSTGDSFTRQISSTSNTLVLPLDVWTTIAQSEQDTSGSLSNLGGNSNQSGRAGYDVQVRLTIK
jgi:hypothetical protein